MDSKVEKLMRGIFHDTVEYGQEMYQKGLDDHARDIKMRKKQMEIESQVIELSKLIDNKDSSSQEA
jgi:hypothetical protein